MTVESKHVLLLWDVDHTLIENSGMSKATYALAFEHLTGSTPAIRPSTDGRTDWEIMRNLYTANGVRLTVAQESQFLDVLADAGRKFAEDLFARGYVLPGVVEALHRLNSCSTTVQSVLTGNIRANAENKLRLLGNSASLLDLEVGGYGSDDTVRSHLVHVAQSKAKHKYGIMFDRFSTVLIGDTERDIAAARDGGARIVAVATGDTPEHELERVGADAVLPDLTDLDALLRNLVELTGKCL